MAVTFKVQELSKKYVIGHEQHAPYATLRETWLRTAKSIGQTLLHPVRKHSVSPEQSTRQEFWALRDVSFEIQKGDRVGIIGRNGAGKSTLLKILSRITEPSSGRVEIHGRVASLLEVGTGFHPELTGRENIFLNAAVLGMRRAEIAGKFDEIVAFAEVEQFLDTPVKRYSSGMYVRLAFAVAAHLDPEILIVDEVLAVGDRQFQEKCLGHMESMSMRDGKTVLFVSHNLDAIQRLCRNALYLREGQLVYQGDVRSAIAQYISSPAHSSVNSELGEIKARWGSGRLRISAVEILDHTKTTTNVLRSGGDYEFILSYRNHDIQESIEDGRVCLEIANSRGVTVLLVSSDFTDEKITFREHGGSIGCTLMDLNLVPGNYTLTLYMGRIGGETLDCLDDVVSISVVGGDYFGTGHPGLPEHCSTLTRCAWQINR